MVGRRIRRIINKYLGDDEYREDYHPKISVDLRGVPVPIDERIAPFVKAMSDFRYKADYPFNTISSCQEKAFPSGRNRVGGAFWVAFEPFKNHIEHDRLLKGLILRVRLTMIGEGSIAKDSPYIQLNYVNDSANPGMFYPVLEVDCSTNVKTSTNPKEEYLERVRESVRIFVKVFTEQSD